MKISYLGQFSANIVFDGDLVYHGMNDGYHPLQDYIDKAEELMDEYGFEWAEIIDDDEDTTIVQITREDDENDVDDIADDGSGLPHSFAE